MIPPEPIATELVARLWEYAEEISDEPYRLIIETLDDYLTSIDAPTTDRWAMLAKEGKGR